MIKCKMQNAECRMQNDSLNAESGVIVWTQLQHMQNKSLPEI